MDHESRAMGWHIIYHSPFIIHVYVFGMIFAQSCSEYVAKNGHDPVITEYWGSVPRSMYTLYKAVTGGVDWENVSNDLARVDWFWVLIFNVYLAFTYFAVMNVVVGVFCQSAIESASHDYENIINVKIREKVNFVRKVHQLFSDIDISGDGKITYHELEAHLTQDNVRAYFEHLGIPVGDVWDLFKILDEDESSFLNMDEFITGCLRLKGPAKVIDVEKMAYENRHMRKKLGSFMKKTDSMLGETLRQIVLCCSRMEVTQGHTLDRFASQDSALGCP